MCTTWDVFSQCSHHFPIHKLFVAYCNDIANKQTISLTSNSDNLPFSLYSHQHGRHHAIFRVGSLLGPASSAEAGWGAVPCRLNRLVRSAAQSSAPALIQLRALAGVGRGGMGTIRQPNGQILLPTVGSAALPTIAADAGNLAATAAGFRLRGISARLPARPDVRCTDERQLLLL